VFERDVPIDLDRGNLPKKDGIGRNNKPYVLYRVPNPEIYDLVNTIEKMACKRALVHAVIAVTRSSGLFTQDLEDVKVEATIMDRVLDPEPDEAEIVVATEEDIVASLDAATAAALAAPTKDARAKILGSLINWCRGAGVTSDRAAKVRESFMASLRAAKEAEQKPAPSAEDDGREPVAQAPA
jgi:hypothetical protein